MDARDGTSLRKKPDRERQGGLSMEQTHMFQLTDSIKQRENIIVFGVGGGGGNALNHIINSGL